MAKGGIEIKDNVLIHAYGEIKEVIVPEGVTEIKDGAFATHRYVERVVLPNTVTKIGDRAFGWCENLSSINIPDSVIEIGERAFVDCGFLREIEFGKNVEKIGSCAFWLCSNLKRVVLSPKLKVIPYSAFYDCIRLRYVEGGENVTVIEQEAFANTCAGSVKLSEKLEEIGDYAFKNSDAHGIEIPASVKKIGKKIADENEWFSIFECYPAERPEGWDEEWNVVDDEEVFTVWDFANSNGVVGKYDKSQLYIEGSVLKHCDGSAKNVYVPDGVTKLADGAFEDCKHIETLSLPASLNTICDDVFRRELTIKTLEFRGTLGEWCEVGFYDFCANPMRYAGKVLIGGKVLKNLDIPEGVTRINNYAFMDLNVAKVTVPEGVYRIGDRAFRDSMITEITLPESLEEIGEDAFSCCGNLYKINFPRGLKKIESEAFYGCSNLLEITLPRDCEVADDAFEDEPNGYEKLIIHYYD